MSRVELEQQERNSM